MLTHHAVGDNLQTKLDFKDCVSINYRRYGAVARRVCRLAVGCVVYLVGVSRFALLLPCRRPGHSVASVRRIMFDIDCRLTFTVCFDSPPNWSSTLTVDEFGSA